MDIHVEGNRRQSTRSVGPTEINSARFWGYRAEDVRSNLLDERPQLPKSFCLLNDTGCSRLITWLAFKSPAAATCQ